MPKLWSETIESHRSEVREAILTTTAELASTRGPFNVTMSKVAQTVGITRATLYKYFSSIEEMLDAWHERQINHHLDHLEAIANGDEPAQRRLAALLEAYAEVVRSRTRHGEGGGGVELSAFLHRPHGRARNARRRLHQLVADLIDEATANNTVGDDLNAEQLAHFCLHALEAAGEMESKSDAHRLVEIVLSAIRHGGA